MHVSELTRQFHGLIGKTLKVTNGQDKRSAIIPDKTCHNTRRTIERLTELAAKFNSKIVINGQQPQSRARCLVHVETGHDPQLGGDRILNIEARILT